MDNEARMLALLEHMLLDESAEPTALPLSLLEKITENFSDDLQIGSGGFSVVYKVLLYEQLSTTTIDKVKRNMIAKKKRSSY